LSLPFYLCISQAYNLTLRLGLVGSIQVKCQNQSRARLLQTVWEIGFGVYKQQLILFSLRLLDIMSPDAAERLEVHLFPLM